MTDVSDEFMIRAAIVKNRIDWLVDEAHHRLDDPERLTAIGAEVDLLLERLHGIREEQLIAMLPSPPRPRRRRWWQRRTTAA